MIVGPVCHFELVRMARRRRLYVMRTAFGLSLLGVIAVNYLGHAEASGRSWYDVGAREFSINELSWFGQSLCVSLMAAQGALVLVLTPALVGDAIASERQRKTLHYLMASRLNSVEIVVGKLTARLLSIGAYLVLSLPILSLLTLFGGIDPEIQLWGYAGIAATGYFLAGIAALMSVLARRPRDAVGAAYALGAIWLVAPPLLDASLLFVPPSWAIVADKVQTANDWIWPASPLGLLTRQGLWSGGLDELRRRMGWLVGSQVAYGTVFIALAAWRLRPAFRRHEGRAGRQPRTRGRGWRLFPRPPCGDDPVYWKEVYVARTGGGIGQQLARLVMPLLLVAAFVGMLYASQWAFNELWQKGYGARGRYDQREEFNIGLRIAGTALFALWMLWLARVTAASFTAEREQDTWLGLLATPLDGAEILRSKMLGALRVTAPIGVTIAALWLLGLAAGAVHPLGLLCALAALALFTWLVTTMGTYISLKAKTTWRAQALAQGILIVPNLCCLLPIASPVMVVGFSLASYSNIHELFSFNFISIDAPWWAYSLYGGYVFGGLAFYVGAAYFLTRGAFRGFDRVAGRPQRSPSRHARPADATPVIVAEPTGDDLA